MPGPFTSRVAGFLHRGGTAPTSGQAWVWNATDEVFEPGTVTQTTPSDFYPHDVNRTVTVIAAPAGSVGDYPAGVLDATNKSASAYTGFFRDTPTAVKLIVVPIIDGQMAWYCITDFGAIGENYNTNSDSLGSDASPQTTSLLDGDLTAIDLTSAFTGAAANDYFGLMFVRDADDAADTHANNVYVLGLLVSY